MKKLIVGAQYKIKSDINPSGLQLKAWDPATQEFNINFYPAVNTMTLESILYSTVTIKYDAINVVYQIKKKMFLDNFRKCRKTSSKISEEILEAINKQMDQIGKPILLMGKSSTVINNDDTKWMTLGNITAGVPSSNDMHITLAQPIEQISMTINIPGGVDPKDAKPKTRFELISEAD